MSQVPIDPERELEEVAWVHRLALAVVRAAHGAHDVARETLLAATRRPPATSIDAQPGLSESSAISRACDHAER